jgi:hypothetical protein
VPRLAWLLAVPGVEGTVGGMEDLSRLLVSHPSPDGSVVVCALGEGVSVRAEFVDEGGWRDVTELVPDLLLIGLDARHGDAAADADAGATSADAAGVEDLLYVGRVFCVGGEPELLFASPAAQVVHPVSFAEARPYIEAGIAAQITAGVAVEAADDPDVRDGAGVSGGAG